MKIVLIGFMCSGKSSVGRLLAKKLSWSFFDTDEIIEKKVGVSVADIIRKKGEESFRLIEKQTVQLVALSDGCVISTGGGVPLDSENMTALSRNGYVCWLKVTPETILRRAGNYKSRPLIDPKDPLGSITKRMVEREAFYSQAHTTIEADTLTVSQIVEKILSSIPGTAT